METFYAISLKEKRMKAKIIDLDEIRDKREGPLIRWFSANGEFEQVTKIIVRRLWREQRRTVTGGRRHQNTG